MNNNQTISIDELKAFEPLAVLSIERLQELQGLIDVEELGVGVTLFREGDVDNQSVYLIEGDVQMNSISDQNLNSTLTHKVNDAKHPLAAGQPRQLTCTALTLTKILRIDNSILDYMLTWDQLAVAEGREREVATLDKTLVIDAAKAESLKETVANTYSGRKSDAKELNSANLSEHNASTLNTNGLENTESDSENTQENTPELESDTEDSGRNWVRGMHHVMAFKNMPPANINNLLQKMETLSVAENEVIIQQGSPGDYYYVLTEGEALVSRVVELASLETGASFGEEALLSGAKRNASVTMKTSGKVMRLAKEDFNELLKEPLLDRVTPVEAQERIAKGDIWIDVRHVTEFVYSHLPKALNIPLHELRMRLKELDKDKSYICYCGTGRRSSAAAFLLLQHGFKVVVLIGGAQKIPQLLVKD